MLLPSSTLSIKALLRHADHKISLILIRLGKIDIIALANLPEVENIGQITFAWRRDLGIRPGQVIQLRVFFRQHSDSSSKN